MLPGGFLAEADLVLQMLNSMHVRVSKRGG